MAAMPAAAGSQLVYVPGCRYSAGGLASGRLLVVPAGVRLPPGTMRLAASSGTNARLLPSSSLACVSTASARRGRLHASASPFAARSIYSGIRAPEPAFLAPTPKSTRRSKTAVAYGAHDQATGAGDEDDVSEGNGADASNKGNNDRARADASKENGDHASKAKDDGDEDDVSEDNGDRATKAKDDGDRVSKEKDDGTDASKAKDNGDRASKAKDDGADASEAKDDGADASKAKDDNGDRASKEKDDGTDASEAKDKDNGNRASKSKDDGDRASKEKDNTKASKDDGGAGSGKERTKDSKGLFRDDWADAWADIAKSMDDLARTLEQNADVSKDDGARASKDNGKVSEDDSTSANQNIADADDTDADATLQGRIDARMILAELELHSLGYEPLKNVWHVSAISYDKRVLQELHTAMRSCNFLLQRAMSRRPPLAKRAKDLVMIGKAFRVVTKEIENGFVQSVSVLTAIEGLKALAMMFLGPYIGFLKPIPNREFPFKPPEDSGERLYFRMLMDYYHTVFDCVRTEILGLFSMDGHEDNFKDL